MKLNLKEDIDEVKNPGDACIVIGKDKNTGERIDQLIVCCPGCGKTSGSAGNHKFDRSTNTYHPSIVHNKDLGGCGWHGWLRNGEFTEC